MVHELNSSRFSNFFLNKKMRFWETVEWKEKKIIYFLSDRRSEEVWTKEAGVWMKWCVFAQNVNRIHRLWSNGKTLTLSSCFLREVLCSLFFFSFTVSSYSASLMLWISFFFSLLSSYGKWFTYFNDFSKKKSRENQNTHAH